MLFDFLKKADVGCYLIYDPDFLLSAYKNRMYISIFYLFSKNVMYFLLCLYDFFQPLK